MLSRVLSIATLLFMLSCGSENKTDSKEKIEEKKDTASVIDQKEEQKVILFFGNSITAGYQLDLDDAFPALIQNKIDAAGYNYKTINAGLSGETSAAGKNRIGWVLQTVPDIFFLELGANDGLRGLKLEETPKNLQAIIDAVKKENPDVQIIVAGMMVPPNLGAEYAKEFQQVFSVLADENNATLVPFLLENVAGNPELNLSDGIHPTAEGHEIVAETVWRYLEPML
ncbi:MAG: arylesterase [Ekhidna sp.]